MEQPRAEERTAEPAERLPRPGPRDAVHPQPFPPLEGPHGAPGARPQDGVHPRRVKALRLEGDLEARDLRLDAGFSAGRSSQQRERGHKSRRRCPACHPDPLGFGRRDSSRLVPILTLSENHGMGQAEPPQDRPALARLRAALRRAGFDEAGVRAAFGSDVVPTDAAERAAATERLEPDSALSTLVRLFVLEAPVSRREAAHALGEALADAAALELVAEDGDLLRPLYQLRPFGPLLLISDLEAMERDKVMGVAPSSALLAHVTTRRQVDSALDLGTGNGVHAIVASTHARHVVATDLNLRALELARQNAVLNGANGIDFRGGSLFEPVQGECFDLIVSNPPYVASPDAEFTHRDGGPAICELIIGDAGSHLSKGGLAFVLATWTHEADGDWSAPVRGWIEDTGCDTILLRYRSEDPASYAAVWNDHLADDPARFRAACERWVSAYERLSIGAISFGLVILRRRSGANWVLAAEAPERIESAGDHVDRLLAAQDWLAGGRDLAYERLVLAKDAQLDGGELRLAEGFGFTAEIDPFFASLISRFDDRTTVRQALDTVTAEAGLAARRDDVYAAVMPLVRRMLELGFLLPRHAA